MTNKDGGRNEYSPDVIRKIYHELMREQGRFACEPHKCFRANKMTGEHEYHSRFVAEYKERDTQLFRYLAKLGFGDSSTIFSEAQKFKRQNKLAAIITEQGELNAMVKRAVRYGVVAELTYEDPDNKSKDGEVLHDSKALKAYCLTQLGAITFKVQTEYTGYIQEQMAKFADIEIMRSLAVNHVIERMQRVFCGDSITRTTEKVLHTTRDVIYGLQQSKDKYIVYEPVFFKRNVNIQTDDELREHYAKRVKFLNALYEEKAQDRRKVLVIVVESLDGVAQAIATLKETLPKVDEAYITTEKLVEQMTDRERVGEQVPMLRLLAKVKVIENPDGSKEERVGYVDAYEDTGLFQINAAMQDEERGENQ